MDKSAPSACEPASKAVVVSVAEPTTCNAAPAETAAPVPEPTLAPETAAPVPEPELDGPLEWSPVGAGQFAMVRTAGQCRLAMEELNKAAVLAVDCEGVDLGMGGRLCLIQVATATKAFLFDMVDETARESMLTAGLRDLLESPTILKIMHDCRGDSAALSAQCGVTLKNVFDTQIAHAVKSALGGRYHPIPTGLGTLLGRHFYDTDPAAKEKMHKMMDEDPEMWLKRPLPQECLVYASKDVLLLHKLYSVFQSLGARSIQVVLDRSAQYTTMHQYSDLRHKQEYPTYNFPDWDKEVHSFVNQLKCQGRWRRK